MNDDLDELLESMCNQKPDPYVDPKYPTIKAGVKFTSNIRYFLEYSVYTIYDAHPNDKNEIVVDEVIYSRVGGGYARFNKLPFRQYMNRDDLLKTHSPAYTRRKLINSKDK